MYKTTCFLLYFICAFSNTYGAGLYDAYTPETEGLVTDSMVIEAVKYPGVQAETHLKNLLRADFHQAQGRYYLNRDKAGFMAQERFLFALEQAIGDIRIAAYINDDGVRQTKTLQLFKNWQQAFKRAQVKNAPED